MEERCGRGPALAPRGASRRWLKISYSLTPVAIARFRESQPPTIGIFTIASHSAWPYRQLGPRAHGPAEGTPASRSSSKLHVNAYLAMGLVQVVEPPVAIKST